MKLALRMMLVLTFAAATAVSAAEVKVFGAEAFKPAFDEIVPGFERATGHKVNVVYATAGVLRDRLRAGEATDVLILPRPSFDPLLAEGWVAQDGSRSIAQSFFALAIPAGAPKPDIATVDALKRTLLATPSIAYSDPSRGGGIGAYAAKVLERLGLTEQMKARTTVTPAGEFRELLARRLVEMAFVLPTVVINDPRVQLVGPLPAELQSPTEFMFAAGLSPQAKEPGAGRALLDYLLSPDALRVLRAKGLDGP